ncbi:hypothetical protein [Elioraea rosea]|uniref:hypothetical protein n=1 Tax=Elioraea rosea TaxID=2492390 RepID=UPI001182FE4B|nr:hypothetical protein [Elioraea rosea]
MTGRALILVGLLALGACASRSTLAPPEGVAANDPRVSRCRAEALDSPRVRALGRRQVPPTYGDAHARWQNELADAERNAFIGCLVREGALAQAPGGVARVNPTSFSPDDTVPPPTTPIGTPDPPRPSGY